MHVVILSSLSLGSLRWLGHYVVLSKAIEHYDTVVIVIVVVGGSGGGVAAKIISSACKDVKESRLKD